ASPLAARGREQGRRAGARRDRRPCRSPVAGAISRAAPLWCVAVIWVANTLEPAAAPHARGRQHVAVGAAAEDFTGLADVDRNACRGVAPSERRASSTRLVNLAE